MENLKIPKFYVKLLYIVSIISAGNNKDTTRVTNDVLMTY